MPNWCETNYVIEGPQEDLTALNNVLTSLKAMETPLVDNGFGVLWVGCLVAILGGDTSKIYCRGEILDFSYENGIIRMHIESAWSELREMRWFIHKKLPKLKFYFQSEEPGMCIFESNDKEGRYFPERWLLDWNDESRNLYLYEYFTDLPAVVAYLKENGVIENDIQPTKEAINAVLDQIQEERPDNISFMLEQFIVVDD